jgi:hypothetical protein
MGIDNRISRRDFLRLLGSRTAIFTLGGVSGITDLCNPNHRSRKPEMFDPVTETWQTLPAASWPRVYHQVALLFPDGRVWVAGGMPVNGVGEARTEVFSPDYLFAAEYFEGRKAAFNDILRVLEGN